MPKKVANVCDLSMYEYALLLSLKARFGRRLKWAIRCAWETGNYSALNLDRYQDNELACMKNNRGLAWLESLRVADL